MTDMPAVSVWNKCNNKCIMCTNGKEYSEGSSEQYVLKKQIEKMEKYLRGERSLFYKGAEDPNYITLTGGEPTLHPDFLKLVCYYRRRCPELEITLLTNGRTLSDKEFIKKYLSAIGSPARTIIPVHSSDPDEHDYVSGVKGSFVQTMRGLENLFGLAPAEHKIGIRFIQHGTGKKRMERTLSMLLDKFPDTSRYTVAIIHYEIEGGSLKNEKNIHISLKDSAKEVLEAKHLIDRFPNLFLYHYPLCVLDESLRGRARITLPEEERVYPDEKCGICCRREDCLGLMIDYYGLFGDSELEPLKK